MPRFEDDADETTGSSDTTPPWIYKDVVINEVLYGSITRSVLTSSSDERMLAIMERGERLLRMSVDFDAQEDAEEQAGSETCVEERVETAETAEDDVDDETRSQNSQANSEYEVAVDEVDGVEKKGDSLENTAGDSGLEDFIVDDLATQTPAPPIDVDGEFASLVGGDGCCVPRWMQTLLTKEEKMAEDMKAEETPPTMPSLQKRIFEILCSYYHFRSMGTTLHNASCLWKPGVFNALRNLTVMRHVKEKPEKSWSSRCDLCGQKEHNNRIALDVGGPTTYGNVTTIDELVEYYTNEFAQSYSDGFACASDGDHPFDSGRIRCGYTCLRAAMTIFRVRNDLVDFLYNAHNQLEGEQRKGPLSSNHYYCCDPKRSKKMAASYRQFTRASLDRSHNDEHLPYPPIDESYWEMIDTHRNGIVPNYAHRNLVGDVLEEANKEAGKLKRCPKRGRNAVQPTEKRRSSRLNRASSEKDDEEEVLVRGSSKRRKGAVVEEEEDVACEQSEAAPVAASESTVEYGDLYNEDDNEVVNQMVDNSDKAARKTQQAMRLVKDLAKQIDLIQRDVTPRAEMDLALISCAQQLCMDACLAPASSSMRGVAIRILNALWDQKQRVGASPLEDRLFVFCMTLLA